VSDDWVERIVGEQLRLARAPAQVVHTLPADAVPGVQRHWILADAGALDRLELDPPTFDQVLVRLDADADVGAVAAELEELTVAAQPSTAAASTVTVRTVAGELAEATAAPTVGGLEGFLLLAASAALALTVLAVLLASITSAGARGRILAVLRVLGLSRRQVRRLLAWELAPVALTAAVVGTGLGLVLPVLITAVLDLRPFVGGRDQPGAAFEPLWIAAGVGTFLLTVVVAGIVAAAVSRRIAPAGALKMGDA